MSGASEKPIESATTMPQKKRDEPDAGGRKDGTGVRPFTTRRALRLPAAARDNSRHLLRQKD